MISAPRLFEIAVRDRLDRALRADRHERRRLDRAVRRRHDAAARAAVGVGDAERERTARTSRNEQFTIR